METINNYIKILFNYTLYFNKHINKNNIEKHKKLYLKGINILFNIYILSYNKLDNNELENLCEKGYIYYIEFINQLNLSCTTENTFELTLKDAILFTYKKTILNLNNIYLRDNIDDYTINIIYIIDKLYIIYYNNILNITDSNIIYNEIIKIIKKINNIDIKYLKKINNYINTNQQLDNTNQQLDNTNQQLDNTNQQLDNTIEQLDNINDYINNIKYII